LIPFIISSVLKTAQGSSTVAIITTAAIIMPMMPDLGLASEWGGILTVLAMGAGSMMVSHANDSYFWVITKFSEIDPAITLKVFSTSTFIMGVVTFICIWLISLLLI
jgi:GntP family gluconate:H+ symporter